MPNEREKTNFEINNERLRELIEELDYTDAYKDGTTIDEWKKHPELFEGYPEDEVNKDSRFLT